MSSVSAVAAEGRSIVIVGLTGGIATGKSSISERLAAKGFLVIDADLIAREVVAPGTDGLREIIAAFGRDYLTENGGLNRDRLGELVFSDSIKRNRLNQIVHPRVRAEMWRRARDYVREDPARIAILDVPLLIEGGTHGLVDVTVVIYAPVPIQRMRLMKRNSLSFEAADRRIAAQMDIESKLQVSDIAVYNIGPENDLDRLADALAAELHRLAADGARADATFDRSVVRKVKIV